MCLKGCFLYGAIIRSEPALCHAGQPRFWRFFGLAGQLGDQAKFSCSKGFETRKCLFRARFRVRNKKSCFGGQGSKLYLSAHLYGVKHPVTTTTVATAATANGTSVVSKALILSFLVCCAPALTALWMSGMFWLILKAWR